MTEEEARTRIGRDVPRETMLLIDKLVALVADENDRQNLIASSTITVMWTRHILDSVQLAWLADGLTGTWLDIGSGGGFPGLVVGILRNTPTILIEPRAKRAAFLRQAVDVLELEGSITVIQSRAQTALIASKPQIISARAVAALPALFDMASGHADANTLWLLPKGRSAEAEVVEARREWQGDFRLEPSLSDPDSAIVVARGVRRKKSG
jgi:16S rRNA (guanine527-N7)-methyltransferase